MSTDSYYKTLSEEQVQLAFRNEYNFDHPNSCDFDLIFEKLS